LEFSMFIFLATAIANDPPPPIVGGSITNSFEHVGAIAALDSNGYGAAFCSGTLIDDTWVVTAAHCIIGDDAAQGMSNQGYDIYFVTSTNVWDAGYGDWHEVKRLVSHPNYSGEDYEIEHDIGLLELKSSISSITPAILNLDEPTAYWGDITYVGYGLTGDNEEDSMGLRRTVDIPMWTYPYPPQEEQFFYTHDPNGQKNICSGDSGGAAFRQTSSGYILAGVNSHGFDQNGGYPYCESSGSVGAAARIDAYISWMEQYVDFQSSSTTGGGTSGGSSDGGSSGGSSDGGESSGGSTTGSQVGGDFQPPFSDDFYDEKTIPAAACQMVSSHHSSKNGVLSIVFMTILVGFHRRRQQ
jgi:hypothetical protein